LDELRGRVPEIYIALKTGLPPSKHIEQKVVRVIETSIGKIAPPKGVRVVPDMPKTRSGKIMRRVLAAISNTMDIGDVTTLANSEIVEQIRIMVKARLRWQPRPAEKTSRLSAKNSRFRVAISLARAAFGRFPSINQAEANPI
jgi:hypothetical protein